MTLLRCLLIAIACLWSLPAAAHLTPNSTISLDFNADHVDATLTIPLSEMSYAGLRADDVAKRVQARSPNGVPWRVSVARVTTVAGPPEADLVAHLILRPPPGADVRQFTLSYDGVIDRVSSHIVMIMVGRDYAGGVLREEPALLGALRQGQTSILVDRGPGSLWRGFLGAVRLGMHHIAEGYDHLLFLLALLLPAPLLAAGGRWTGHRDTRSMVRKLAAIITAFTVGHSLTLLGGAFLGWTLPTQPVEIAIALSILISAIHAWRPLFAGREMFVAGGFGLIHGLAFATTISAFALDPFHKAQAILGFNLGIELVQLGIILVLLPLLIWFGRRPLYQRVRAALALPAGILAILWMIERIAGVSIIPG